VRMRKMHDHVITRRRARHIVVDDISLGRAGSSRLERRHDDGLDERVGVYIARRSTVVAGPFISGQPPEMIAVCPTDDVRLSRRLTSKMKVLRL